MNPLIPEREIAVSAGSCSGRWAFVRSHHDYQVILHRMAIKVRQFWRRFAWVSLAAWSVAGCSGDSVLHSAAQFVSDFRDEQGRLPNQVEFDAWAGHYSKAYKFSYFTNQPSGLRSWGVQGKDFVVGVRLATNALTTDYFCSWDKRVFDGFLQTP